MIAYVTLLLPLGYALSSALVAISISIYYGSRNFLGIATRRNRSSFRDLLSFHARSVCFFAAASVGMSHA